MYYVSKTTKIQRVFSFSYMERHGDLICLLICVSCILGNVKNELEKCVQAFFFNRFIFPSAFIPDNSGLVSRVSSTCEFGSTLE